MKEILKKYKSMYFLLIVFFISCVALIPGSVSKYVMDLGEVGSFSLDVEPSGTLPTAKEFRNSIYQAKTAANQGDPIRIVFDRWDAALGYQNSTYGSVDISADEWNSGYNVDAFGGIKVFIVANSDRPNTSTAYILSEKDITAPSDSSSLFSGVNYNTFKKIEEIIFDNFYLPTRFTANKIFDGCTGLKTLDLSRWADFNDTTTYIQLNGAFNNCTSLTKLSLSGLDFTRNSYIFDSGTFQKLTSLNYLDISKTVWAGANIEYLFNIKYPQTVNMTGIRSERVTEIDDLFNGWSNLREIIGFSDFNTRDLTSIEQTFVGCVNLPDVYFEQFANNLGNGSKVTSCFEAFLNCYNLTAPTAQKLVNALGNNSISAMYGMFNNCTGIKGGIDMSALQTASVADMRNVFKGCTGLTSVKLSGFNTSNVTNMSSMFEGCTGLKELDLSSFNIKKTTNLRKLFAGCTNLTTIYVGNNWILNERVFVEYDHPTAPLYNRGSAGMFKDCTSLVGGAGTVYDANNTNATYARIDGDLPGYLTAVSDMLLPINVTQNVVGVTVGTNTPSIYPGLSASLSISANEGYSLPESFIVEIGGTEYTVECASGTVTGTDEVSGITYDTTAGILKISYDLLKNNPQINITIIAIESQILEGH